MADPRSSIRLPPPATQRNYSIQPNTNYTGQVRDVSAYAADLASWGNTHKHKFMFVTEIELQPEYIGIADMTRFSLLNQSASRPKIKFEHTDFNEYGIRKGVLTKTTFEPISMSFLDDNENSAMQFFTNVLKLMSPITNIDESALVDNRQYDFKTGLGALTTINSSRSGVNIQERTFGEYRPNVYAQSSGAPGNKLTNMRSTGAAPTSLFKSVKVHHVHLFGEGVNTFTFKNPRLLSMDFDDLDMSSSDDIALLKLTFAYDYLTSAAGQMTAEISRLVGPTTYYLRRDLSNDSGGSVNQQSQTYVEPNLAVDQTPQQMTLKQFEQQQTEIAAAKAQAEQAASDAERLRYNNLADGLKSPSFTA
jgi:hypothetical protein